MSRPRQRVCLDAGLKLNLNKLRRQKCILPGAITTWRSEWNDGYTGEGTASAFIICNMTNAYEGRMEIRLGNTEQTIFLVPKSRHFGGSQWYFICPVVNGCCSVLWRPPGAKRFASRQAWGRRRVAYSSQFLDRDNRAHRGKAKIKSRLIANLDPDDWEFPPKPKWMRWRYALNTRTRCSVAPDGVAPAQLFHRER
jgi:hypothetical protein